METNARKQHTKLDFKSIINHFKMNNVVWNN